MFAADDDELSVLIVNVHSHRNPSVNGIHPQLSPDLDDRAVSIVINGSDEFQIFSSWCQL